MKKVHEFRDDLELFLHVLLYHSIRYIKHDASHFFEISSTVYRHFDSTFRDNLQQTRGGEGKRDYFNYALPAPLGYATISKFLHPAHATLIDDLQILFVPLYTRMERNLGKLYPSKDNALKQLVSSEKYLQIFKEHLGKDGWPTHNKSCDMLRFWPPPSDILLLLQASNIWASKTPSFNKCSTREGTFGKAGCKSGHFGFE